VCLVLVGLLVGVVLAALPVAAPPPIPMRIQGQAFDRLGSPLPIGTPIRAFVDGVDYSNGSSVQNGAGTYSLLIAGNSKTNANVSDTPTGQEGANLGDAVLVAAGDFTTSANVFQEVISWSPGTVVIANLNLGSAASTPQPLKIQGIVTQPARGGNQFVFVCNPSSGSVSLADYYLELDTPGTYQGARFSLTGVLGATGIARQDLPSSTWLTATGDALKLVYRNPGGAAASAGGRDIVVDRVEFNATSRGTLNWEPGNTSLGDAAAPGPGRILGRDASCTDTNRPSDFSLTTEPGVASTSNLTLGISSPTPGQTLPAASVVDLAWIMSDDVFQTGYVHVWANVTIGSQTIPVLVDQLGATSVRWTTPDFTGTAILKIDAEDPFGAHASATSNFALTRQTPLALIVAVLIVVVIVAFLVFAFLRARKKEAPPPTGPPPMPPAAPSPPSTIGPAAGAVPPALGKKVCPRCHTAVNTIDATCFFCGYKFPDATPPP